MTTIPSIVSVASMLAAVVAAAPERELETLRTMDLRLAVVGYRLATANVALCADRAPGTGLVVHAIDQYAPSLRGAARKVFGFAAPVAVEGAIPGSPAERSGVRAADALIAIDGATLTDRADASTATTATRDTALDRIARVAPGGTLRLDMLRDGRRHVVSVATVPACRAAFEVVIGRTLFAQADASVVQVSSTHFERHDDDGIAVTAAHELAHVILRHRARLEAAGVKRGLAGKFGRDRRLTRQAEDEADRWSVYLLRNAGYDPRIAVRYWQDRATTSRSGPLGYRTHASPAERARMIAAEIAAIAPGTPVPSRPGTVLPKGRISQ